MDNLHTIHDQTLGRKQQELLLNQNGRVLWFTGLSGSGKSTIAAALENELYRRGYFVKLLDGDNIRAGINNDLGFSIENRRENIRRIAEVAKLFVDAGAIVLCSFVSPTEEIRKIAKSIIGPDFNLVFVDASLATCEKRDVKGLYAKARRGEIKDFTGIGSPFEEPTEFRLKLETEHEPLENCVEKCLEIIEVQ